MEAVIEETASMMSMNTTTNSDISNVVFVDDYQHYYDRDKDDYYVNESEDVEQYGAESRQYEAEEFE